MLIQVIKAILCLVLLGVVAPLLLNAGLLWAGVSVWPIIAAAAWIGWLVLLTSFVLVEIDEL